MIEPIFPGMDPFIEDQDWAWFHNSFIIRIADELARLLVPLYSVKSEAYIYLGTRPDVYISRGKPGTEPLERSNLAIADATHIIVPDFFAEDEPLHVAIRDENGELVTIIEVLSSSNKKQDRARYLANRKAMAEIGVHLIEIDLLRSGKRMEANMPKEGYVILVARALQDKSYRGEVYAMGLRDPFPIIPVPLKPDDQDVPLDLPTLFKDVYISARFRLQLDYNRLPDVPFSPADQTWAESIISADRT